MTDSAYLYDQGWERERERLAGIEALWDPGPRRLIEALGIAPGWRCLEVGGGGGSIVEWLSERVGDEGHVLATDLDTRFIDAIDAPNVEARRHDILAGELPEAHFDLVHARLVLEHIPQREQALERMAAACRPGGWVLIEDYDWSCYGTHPSTTAARRVTEAVLGYMEQVAGFESGFGRRLVAALREAGLADVDADGRVRVIGAGHPGADFFRLSLEQLRAPLLEAGAVSESDARQALELFDEPGMTLLTPLLLAAWGRRAPS